MRVPVKHRVWVSDRFRCSMRFMIRFMVRVRSQQAPGTDPTAEQLSPQRV